MKVLVACEESQRVCIAFRSKGHEAYSCDIQDCSGGHPEWHIKADALEVMRYNWDMIIAHPPCTYLTVAGNFYFNVEKWGQKAIDRLQKRSEAIDFFMEIADNDCPKIAIENPVGVMSTYFRKPDQIIQPYEFGHPYTKRTCLWLKGLPKLKPTNILEKPANGWENQHFTKEGRYGGFGGKWGVHDGKWRRYGDPEVAKERSKTFPGIAQAMADQWG